MSFYVLSCNADRSNSVWIRASRTFLFRQSGKIFVQRYFNRNIKPFRVLRASSLVHRSLHFSAAAAMEHTAATHCAHANRGSQRNQMFLFFFPFLQPLSCCLPDAHLTSKMHNETSSACTLCELLVLAVEEFVQIVHVCVRPDPDLNIWTRVKVPWASVLDFP